MINVRREAVKRKHHDLDVWRDGIRLVTLLYKATARFPAVEKFGLTAQLRRAAVSVPSNIAEGARGQHKKTSRVFYIWREGHCQKSILKGASKNSDFRVVARKRRAQNRSVCVVYMRIRARR